MGARLMTRLSVFNSPLLLGFDHVERVLDRVAKSATDGYPPYNIEQTGTNALRISLAVAGFAREDLSVTIEDNQLIVRGRQGAEDDKKVYLHRGIAARQFQKAFVLAEGIEIVRAAMDNGLLHIDLRRPVPASVVRSIPIDGGARGAADALDNEDSGAERISGPNGGADTAR